MNCERQLPHMDYLEHLVRAPNWAYGRNVEVVNVEVSVNCGYNRFTVQGAAERIRR